MVLFLYLVIGLAAGVLAGMFGIGGGIIIIPALVFLAGMDQQTAQGTSLGALLMPVGIIGAIYYYRHGHMNLPAAALIGLGLLLATGVGAWLNLRMTPDAARRVFAVFLALMAVRMWFK
ncbi:MAG TPA: TSUP family transporter [Gemmatimonadaceae bacterium]|nr:TSUP family transporter [Gemmatimonadaceae bacterium]